MSDARPLVDGGEIVRCPECNAAVIKDDSAALRARAEKAERERDEARAEIVNQRRQHQDARAEFSRIYDLCSTVQEQRDAAGARAEKLADALREIADERTHWAELKGIAARALAEIERKDKP